MYVHEKHYRSTPQLPFQLQRYTRKRQNETCHGNVPQTRAQATTGDIFTAARNPVRMIHFNRFPQDLIIKLELSKFLINLIGWEG